MFNAILLLQWKSARPWIIASMVAMILLPLISVTRAWPSDSTEMALFLAELDLWSLLYPAAAIAIGVAMGIVTWHSDRRNDFVYALTLPIARSRYVLLRFGAGMVWLTAIALLLGLAATVAVAMVDVPATLNAHPIRLALKFALAGLAVFATAFAFAALPTRARRIGVRVVLILLAVQFAAVQIDPEANLIRPLVEVLIGPAGPFAALGGRWMLIDV